MGVVIDNVITGCFEFGNSLNRRTLGSGIVPFGFIGFMNGTTSLQDAEKNYGDEKQVVSHG